MPKDAEGEAAAGRLDRLDQLVFRIPASRGEAIPDLPDSLVMVALDHKSLAAGRLGNERSGREAHLMLRPGARERPMALMPDPLGQVLIQGAARRNVQELHPTADPQQGHLPLERALRERELKAVAVRVRAGGLRVG